MTTSNVAVNSYFELECRWGDSTSNTAVSIAPNLYRWDRYDVYASASYTETLTEPNGTTGSWSFSKSVSTSGGYSWLDNFATRTYSRKEAAYTITLKLGYTAGSSWGGSYHSLSGTATFTLNVPALASYNVTFNANSGGGTVSNMPSTQKKYYGKALTLSSAVPERENYAFVGWNTAADGSGTNYAAGSSYTSNAALTLYAKWQLTEKPPTMTLTAYRVNSSSSTTESGTGTYAYVQAVWSKGDENVTAVKYSYLKNGTTSGSGNMGGTVTGASGTATKWIALGTNEFITVTVTAEGSSSAVKTAQSKDVSSVVYPIYFYDQYKTRIHNLFLEERSYRPQDTGTLNSQGCGSVIPVYTTNVTIEEGFYWYSADTVTVAFKITRTSNTAIGYENSPFRIPEEYAPPVQVLFPIFTTTTGWADFIVGCAVMDTDGYIHWWSKAMGVYFGSVTYTRRPSNWTAPSTT